jgi:hypothetical protein
MRPPEERPWLARTAAGRRRWIVPVIGTLTPAGLLVVNIAAFIVKHLSAFRWSITVLAFVSGMMLNAWTALTLYQLLRRVRPQNPLVAEGNQELVLMAGMAVVTAVSVLVAWLCYQGLSDASQLPNLSTSLFGLGGVALLFVGQSVKRRVLGESR